MNARARTPQAILGAALLAAALSAHAGSVTLTDPNSDFSVTYDDTQTGLFGTPILSHNTVFFIPSNFFATSLNGDGAQSTADSIDLVLTASTPGFSLDVFDLEARGDYMLDGPGASVSIDADIEIASTAEPQFTFTDDLQTEAPLTVNDGNLHNWNADALIDDALGWNGAQQVSLSLTTLLMASTTDLSTSAFIEKKFEGVQISVSQVPVPGTIWLLLSALMPIVLRRSRG